MKFNNKFSVVLGVPTVQHFSLEFLASASAIAKQVSKMRLTMLRNLTAFIRDDRGAEFQNIYYLK